MTGDTVRYSATLLLLLLLSVVGCGATLTVEGRAPDQLDAGLCGQPSRLLSAAHDTVMVHALIVGRSERDSLLRVPGAPFTFSWAVPAGQYLVRSWASNAAGPGCDTTITAWATADATPPAVVRIFQRRIVAPVRIVR